MLEKYCIHQLYFVKAKLSFDLMPCVSFWTRLSHTGWAHFLESLNIDPVINWMFSFRLIC